MNCYRCGNRNKKIFICTHCGFNLAREEARREIKKYQNIISEINMDIGNYVKGIGSGEFVEFFLAAMKKREKEFYALPEFEGPFIAHDIKHIEPINQIMIKMFNKEIDNWERELKQ